MEITPFADQKVLLVRRWDAIRPDCYCASLRSDSNQRQRSEFPQGSWRTVLDSNEERWQGGGGATTDELQSNGEMQLRLTPWAFLVLWQNAPETRRP